MAMAMAAAVYRNPALAVLGMAAAIVLSGLASPAAALVPYVPGGGGLWWDLLHHEDPFRVLEQAPVAVPRAGELSPAMVARCDWKETPEAHVVALDVPGVKREDVRVEVEEGSRVVRVSGERKAEAAAAEGERWHRAERAAAGRFWRRFRMPAGADLGRVEARLADGVLTVTVPKVPGHGRREPRVVSIAGGAGYGEMGGAEAEVVKPSKAEM